MPQIFDLEGGPRDKQLLPQDFGIYAGDREGFQDSGIPNASDRKRDYTPTQQDAGFYPVRRPEGGMTGDAQILQRIDVDVGEKGPRLRIKTIEISKDFHMISSSWPGGSG